MMEDKQFELPEVGSKWEVLVDYPQGANVKFGDVVSVSSSNSLGSVVFLDDLEYEWVAAPTLWYTNFRPLETEKAPTESTEEASLGYTPKNIKGKGSLTGKIISDGGPSEYYDFQDGWVTWNDLADYKAVNQWKEYSFHLGNVGKVLMRWGDKAGATLVYDTHKLIYSGLRVLKMLVGVNKTREYLIRLLEDKQFKEGE